MKSDGIILDIDGTVWDSTQLVANAWNKAIQCSKIPGAATLVEKNPLTSEILKTVFGKTMDIIADELFFSLKKNDRYKLLEECDIYETKFLEENKQDITYEGITETIKILSKTYKVFIVSNCQKGYIEHCLDQNKLWPYITAIECFGNTGKKKAYNIAKIVRENNIKQPVYVGDTQMDYIAATENNIPFIWAAYGFGKPENYTEKITKPVELLKLFT
ncbi:MAG: hypothetical protein BKP49_03690 [Treponema sp. CETP13]|nr:MAG: hypothetical protein BKP49_03690 [Treponema sp. CETP13]